MIYILGFVFFSALILPGAAIGDETLSSYDILAKADKKIIPVNANYSISLKVDDGAKVRNYAFKGFKKGQEKNLLLQMEPKSAIGVSYLRKADNIWTYYPTIHKTMRYAYMSIFLNSTLNYGDVMSTELVRDYDPAALEIETVEGKKAYKITMTPKKGHDGYARIITWITKENYLPIKREYYALSGVLMKTALFEKFVFSPEGRIESAILYFYEPLKKQSTTVFYGDIQEQETIEDSLFNPNNLRYLSGR